ncbi:molybdenum ABC transporter ATP-binding protein [Bowmanella denitrificans]|uniref:Molybdenum ABC transporter ATP-binding protein n=1 Tax=Bowmanella denitrificans TaxID=366582 RepID=A0ABN0WSG7_9ALTE
MDKIEISLDLQLSKQFNLALDCVLPGKGITGIFGHSGSGKTSLLRFIAGLQPCAGASLTVAGQIWQQGKQKLAVHQRPLGYVFQEASLFAHLTVQGNLDYARKRAWPGTGIPYPQIVELLGIDGLLRQLPDALSGGERQRVAIARALLVNPSLLLMDEPLASLDEKRKQEFLPYLHNLHQELAIPVLYVTHSLAELTRLADYVLMLEQGKLKAQGSIAELSRQLGLADPDAPFCVLDAVVTASHPQWHLVSAQSQSASLWLPDSGLKVGEPLRLHILARDISLSLGNHNDSSILNRLPARVESVNTVQDAVMVELSSNAGALLAKISLRSAEHLHLQVGQSLFAQIKSMALSR